jgi:uncharacterized protein YbjT (DUF2867 family)
MAPHRPLRILILGATGAAGGALLDAALADEGVALIRTITRRPMSSDTTHVGSVARHVNHVHNDLSQLQSAADCFSDLDVGFFCIGRSVTQVSDEPSYRSMALDLPLAAAALLKQRSPDACFHYLSGQGAALNSRQMWARVKFEAEQALRAQFHAVCWRPGAIDATRQDGWPKLYRVVIPMMRVLAPWRSVYVKATDLALAMLSVAAVGRQDEVFENRQIRDLADARRGSL